jgi:hypothetical protein
VNLDGARFKCNREAIDSTAIDKRLTRIRKATDLPSIAKRCAARTQDFLLVIVRLGRQT